LDQAKNWLEKSFALGDAKKMKLATLDDPDLEPLQKIPAFPSAATSCYANACR
jgi:hypothetical protein